MTIEGAGQRRGPAGLFGCRVMHGQVVTDGLERQLAALFREDEFYAEGIIGEELSLDTFFLVAAGFAVGDHHRKPMEGIFSREGSQGL